jgi:hypothetical protein
MKIQALLIYLGHLTTVQKIALSQFQGKKRNFGATKRDESTKFVFKKT